MVPEKATNFYNVSITFKVRTSTDIHDNLSVSVVYTLPPATPVLPHVGAQRREESGTPTIVRNQHRGNISPMNYSTIERCY